MHTVNKKKVLCFFSGYRPKSREFTCWVLMWLPFGQAGQHIIDIMNWGLEEICLSPNIGIFSGLRFFVGCLFPENWYISCKMKNPAISFDAYTTADAWNSASTEIYLHNHPLSGWLKHVSSKCQYCCGSTALHLRAEIQIS